jgi:hypothetical protein
MWSVGMWGELKWFMWSYFLLKRNEVKCRVVGWTDVIYVKWFSFKAQWSEVKWVTMKFCWIKVLCTLGWLYTAGIWLYCDYFIWVYLFCVCFNLYCGGFTLFCNMCVCVRACAHACMCMCVCVCVCACAHAGKGRAASIFLMEVRWAPQLLWTLWKEKIFLSLPRI